MTSELEKLYENCNIKPKQKGYCDWGDYCPRPYNKCDDECPSWIAEVKYQPFTAEKQIELIKWLAKQPLTIDNVDGEFEFSTGYRLSDFGSFEESLAEIINNLWQDLTEEQKQQVKGILK